MGFKHSVHQFYGPEKSEDIWTSLIAVHRLVVLLSYGERPS